MSVDPSNIAVLTGDIVNSTSLGREDRDAVFAALSAGAKSVESLQNFPPQFERFSGDSWQMLVQPKFALRACLLLRAYIRQESKAYETRISVGVGAIEPLSPQGLGASDGPAFQASGRALTALKRDRYLCINTDLNPVFILADEISKRWTQAQARVVAISLLLPRPTQARVSSRIGISQQSVWTHQKAAGVPALLAVLEGLENSP